MSAFEFHFPDGVAVPPKLEALADFCGRMDDFFSGDFELRSDDDDAACWCHANREEASKLAVFGQEGDGSLYALWLRDGSSADSAPVVFLCSEGDASRVLANTLEDFLAILSVGADGLGRWGPASAPDEPAPHLSAYRGWLEETIGRAPLDAAAAQALMDAAKPHAAAFEQFIKSAQGE